MKYPKSQLLTSFAASIAFAACVMADEPKTANWQSLFNGKDLAGWQVVNEATFVVTNGNLQLVGGVGWLRTEKQFADFILEAEWRALVPEYDSGFFIRAGLDGAPWPKGAWQVNLKDNSLGGLVKGTRTIVPAETPRMPVGKWVRFRIEVRGKRILLNVDGEDAWEFGELDTGRGYIGIQAENKAFEFRNLRVQELSSVGSRPNSEPVKMAASSCHSRRNTL